MIRKIFVPLDKVELSALAKLAEREKRDLRAQAAMLIKQGLEHLGLLQQPASDIESADDRSK